MAACTEQEAPQSGARAHGTGDGSELSPLEHYLGKGAVSLECGFGVSMDGSSLDGPFGLSQDQLRRKREVRIELEAEFVEEHRDELEQHRERLAEGG